MALARYLNRMSDITTTAGVANSNFCSYTPPNDTVGGYIAVIVGKDPSQNICTRCLVGRYKKTAGGVLTLPGSIQTVSQYTDLALLTTNATVVASAGAIFLQAQGGLLGTNLEWQGDIWIDVA